jgi:hypothetical protein
MKVLRFLIGLILLGGLIVLLAMGPTPGPVLRNNAEQEIEATALFYMDLDEMQELERRLEEMKAEKAQAEAVTGG